MYMYAWRNYSMLHQYQRVSQTEKNFLAMKREEQSGACVIPNLDPATVFALPQRRGIAGWNAVWMAEWNRWKGREKSPVGLESNASGLGRDDMKFLAVKQAYMYMWAVWYSFNICSRNATHARTEYQFLAETG